MSDRDALEEAMDELYFEGSASTRCCSQEDHVANERAVEAAKAIIRAIAFPK